MNEGVIRSLSYTLDSSRSKMASLSTNQKPQKTQRPITVINSKTEHSDWPTYEACQLRSDWRNIHIDSHNIGLMTFDRDNIVGYERLKNYNTWQSDGQ